MPKCMPIPSSWRCFRQIVPLKFLFVNNTTKDSGSFTLEGANYPGIVHKVTSFMAMNGLSVDKLETSDEIAPHGGTTLFKMKGVANALEPLATGFDVNEIKQKLSSLGDELNCDIEMVDN